jgi:hypothetical protein
VTLCQALSGQGKDWIMEEYTAGMLKHRIMKDGYDTAQTRTWELLPIHKEVHHRFTFEEWFNFVFSLPKEDIVKSEIMTIIQ